METQNPPAAVSAPVDARDILQKILDGLGLQTKVERMTHEGATRLHVATADPGRLIGKRGQTLRQLQFLVNRIIQRQDPSAPRITVDCERYRERQSSDVLKKVIEAADTVRRWGEPASIGPYNALDRRTIHQHMLNDPELEVVSDGEEDGGSKKMTIRLKHKT